MHTSAIISSMLIEIKTARIMLIWGQRLFPSFSKINEMTQLYRCLYYGNIPTRYANCLLLFIARCGQAMSAIQHEREATLGASSPRFLSSSPRHTGHHIPLPGAMSHVSSMSRNPPMILGTGVRNKKNMHNKLTLFYVEGPHIVHYIKRRNTSAVSSTGLYIMVPWYYVGT